MAGSAIDSVDRKELQRKLIALREEHGDLDQAIAALSSSGTTNQLRVQRLKKRKLAIKDQIARVENALLPDIIA